MRVAFALLVTFVACASDPASVSEADHGALGDPTVRGKLREIALKASSHSGVASPDKILAVASPDHQVAEEIVSGGSIVLDHAAVYVVLVTGGTFSADHAPPGVPFPQGNALTLTVNAQTFDVTDAGILKDAPDLHQISPEVVDLLAD